MADVRRKVRDLLKLFVNSEEHNKRQGRPFYDLSSPWEKPGIEREEE